MEINQKNIKTLIISTSLAFLLMACQSGTGDQTNNPNPDIQEDPLLTKLSTINEGIGTAYNLTFSEELTQLNDLIAKIIDDMSRANKSLIFHSTEQKGIDKQNGPFDYEMPDLSLNYKNKSLIKGKVKAQGVNNGTAGNMNVTLDSSFEPLNISSDAQIIIAGTSHEEMKFSFSAAENKQVEQTVMNAVFRLSGDHAAKLAMEISAIVTEVTNNTSITNLTAKIFVVSGGKTASCNVVIDEANSSNIKVQCKLFEKPIAPQAEKPKVENNGNCNATILEKAKIIANIQSRDVDPLSASTINALKQGCKASNKDLVLFTEAFLCSISASPAFKADVDVQNAIDNLEYFDSSESDLCEEINSL